MSPCRAQAKSGAGFVLPSAIFLLVILASLAAFLVRISVTQSTTSAQDVQGVRAYQAARAGVEWGLYQVLDPGNATVVLPSNAAWPNQPACVSGSITIEGFTVDVSCTASDYLEAGNNRRIRVYRLTANAHAGTVGTMARVEREVAVTVSKCRALDGVAPDYACP